MEEEGLLNRSDDFDILCLHRCCTTLLQDTLSGFMEAWNSHPIRTENNLTPLQLFHCGLRELDPDSEELVQVQMYLSIFSRINK